MLHDTRQHLFPVHISPHETLQRSGIRSVTPKDGLIHIDTHTYNTVADTFSLQITLYQRAADFLFTHVNRIWPYHRHAIHIVLQCLTNGNSHTLGNQKLVSSKQESGVAEQ